MLLLLTYIYFIKIKMEHNIVTPTSFKLIKNAAEYATGQDILNSQNTKYFDNVELGRKEFQKN